MVASGTPSPGDGGADGGSATEEAGRRQEEGGGKYLSALVDAEIAAARILASRPLTTAEASNLSLARLQAEPGSGSDDDDDGDDDDAEDVRYLVAAVQSETRATQILASRPLTADETAARSLARFRAQPRRDSHSPAVVGCLVRLLCAPSNSVPAANRQASSETRVSVP